jgi:hypothetical protein
VQLPVLALVLAFPGLLWRTQGQATAGVPALSSEQADELLRPQVERPQE